MPRLKSVEFATPYSELAAKLSGDYAHDRKLILNFCAQHGVSEATVKSRLKPYEKHHQ